jgi:hypothetical protein
MGVGVFFSFLMVRDFILARAFVEFSRLAPGRSLDASNQSLIKYLVDHYTTVFGIQDNKMSQFN